MRLKDIVRSPKDITDRGTWKSGVKMPPSAFPITKGKMQVRKVYTWKVIKFKCLGRRYRLLIFFRSDKQIFCSYLAEDVSGVMAIIAKYEYHSTHTGWHLHAAPGCETENAEVGRIGIAEKFEIERLPRGHSNHRRCEFGVATDEQAQDKAMRAFGLYRREDMLP